MLIFDLRRALRNQPNRGYPRARTKPTVTIRHDELPATSDDVASRSDDELYDILTHIDRHQAAERYRAVRDEFARRHGSTIKGQSLDDYFDGARPHRPFAKHFAFKKKILVGLAIWSLAMLLVRAVLYLRSLK